jgi:hypothetical protein
MAKYEPRSSRAALLARPCPSLAQGAHSWVALSALADTPPDARREFGTFLGIPEDKRYADSRMLTPNAQTSSTCARGTNGTLKW